MLQSNVQKYYYFSFFVRLSFYTPVFVILLTNRGLDLTQVLTVQAAHSLGALLAEVPCGAFADKYNKKWSLVIGSFLWALTLFAYGVSGDFLAFSVWAFIGGIAQAFLSGADSVLLHETLESMGEDDRYEEVEGKSKGLYTAGRVVATAVSGLIAKISLPLTLFLSSASVFLSTIIAILFKVPSVDIDLERPPIIQTIIEGFEQNLKKRELLWLTVYLAVSNGIFWSSTALTQPYLELINFPLEYFGFLFAGFTLVTAYLATKVESLKNIKIHSTLLFILFTTAVSSILIGVFQSLSVFLLWITIEAAILITPFLVTARTLRISNQAHSTTILSFQSLYTRLINIVISPIIGFVATRFGVLGGFQFIGVLLLTLLAILMVMPRESESI